MENNKKLLAISAANELTILSGSENFTKDVFVYYDLILLLSEGEDINEVIELMFELVFDSI